MPEFIGMGEILIDFISMKTGVKVRDSPGFYKYAGGAPANTTVGVSRLGHSSGFITKLGDDEFGKYLLSVLEENKVDTSHVIWSREARTALAFVSIDEKGERSFEFYRHPAADQLIRPDEISGEYIKSAKILHLGSVGMAVEPSRSAHIHAMKVAKENGVLVSFDPNIRENLWPDPSVMRSVILSAIPLCDIFLPSEDEMAFLFDDLETGAKKVLDMGVSIVVIKMGAKGAVAYTKEQKIFQKPFKVEVVSTVGAGDAFNAGFLHGYLSGKEISKSLLYGAGCAARVITMKGAMSALPRADELEDFIREHSSLV
ncbi:MAG: carbohydrate kinase [Candidatus Korarchaeota archaeon]